MTEALQEAMQAAGRLPPADQDELAARIIADVGREDDRAPETDEWGAEPARQVW